MTLLRLFQNDHLKIVPSSKKYFLFGKQSALTAFIKAVEEVIHNVMFITVGSFPWTELNYSFLYINPTNQQSFFKLASKQVNLQKQIIVACILAFLQLLPPFYLFLWILTQIWILSLFYSSFWLLIPHHRYFLHHLIHHLKHRLLHAQLQDNIPNCRVTLHQQELLQLQNLVQAIL